MTRRPAPSPTVGRPRVAVRVDRTVVPATEPEPVSDSSDRPARRLAVERADQSPGAGAGPAGGIVARLNREWAWLADQAPDWPCPWGATLGQVLAAVADRPDAVLGHLIAACQAGHDRAGRVVVQAFLGKIVLLSRRDSRLDPDDLVAAFWIRLSRYPLERRPSKIAANLVLDTRKDVLAEARELACLTPPPPSDPLTARGVLNAALSLNLVSAPTAAIVATVYADGLTSAKAAARHDTSAEAVRWRCSDTVRRLRRHRVALAESCAA